MNEVEKASFATLAYADIFDYPLKIAEIYRFMVSPKKVDSSILEKILFQMKTDLKFVETKDGFYFLPSRKNITLLRESRRQWSRRKLKIAQKVASWLRLIPTIKMVGVTGALAMENSDKDDDIDLLIVTSKNQLWLTRLWATILVGLVAKRRRPGDKDIKDKICLNMFLDGDHLKVPKKEQDLFSAHEVCQMRPLWDRDNTYKKFLWENRWVRKYLPNAIDTKILGYYDIKNKKFLNYLITQLLNFFENLAYKLQLKYMHSRQTSEITEPSRIRFHPQDARSWVLKEYNLRLKKIRT